MPPADVATQHNEKTHLTRGEKTLGPSCHQMNCDVRWSFHLIESSLSVNKVELIHRDRLKVATARVQV